MASTEKPFSASAFTAAGTTLAVLLFGLAVARVALRHEPPVVVAQPPRTGADLPGPTAWPRVDVDPAVAVAPDAGSGSVAEGRALDEAGAPVAGAALVLVPSAPDGMVRRVLTGAAGTFRLAGVPPGSFGLEGDAPGLLPPARLAVEVELGASAVATVVFRHGAALAGRVVDAAGAPIAGALVEVRGEGGRLIASAAERARRAAWAAGISGPAPGGRLVPSGELGVLLGSIPYPPPPGSGPPASAPTGSPPEADPVVRGFITAADGRFRVDALPTGRVSVHAGAPGFAAGDSAPVEVRPGAVPDVPVVLRRGGALTVLVVDESGRALPGVQVHVGGAGFGVSDASGQARFEHVVGTVTLTADGRGRAHVEREVAEVADLEARTEAITLPPSAEAAGAAPGAAGAGTVRADLRDALTLGPILAFTIAGRGPDGTLVHKAGARGELTLGPLGAGTWTLTVEARGFGTGVTTVEVAAGLETPVRIELSQGGVVGGTVYSQHGEAVAGASVVCGPVRATTTPTGAFRLAGTPTGEVLVQASHPAWGQGSVVVPLHPGDEALTLQIRLGP